MKTLAMIAVIAVGCLAAISAYDFGTGGELGILPSSVMPRVTPESSVAAPAPSCCETNTAAPQRCWAKVLPAVRAAKEDDSADDFDLEFDNP